MPLGGINLSAINTDTSKLIGNLTPSGGGVASGVVQLTNLSAIVSGDILFVKWRTASEKNNKSFDIEASPDKVHFITIGEIQSLDEDGNSTAALSYEFSADLAGVSLVNSGIIVALFALGNMAMGLSRKIRWVFTGLMITALLTGVTGCKKQSAEPASDTSHTYVRIAQIDQNGSKTYSKIINVVNKN